MTEFNCIYFHCLCHYKTVTPHQILSDHQIKEDERGGACNIYGKEEKHILVVATKML
jgi:hypothetical protein